jgi:hypothetical protein
LQKKSPGVENCTGGFFARMPGVQNPNIAAIVPPICSSGFGTNTFILAVCCASRVKPQKIADQAIFYPSNCQVAAAARTPDNRDFWATGGTKINKCNRLLGLHALPKPKVSLCYEQGEILNLKGHGALRLCPV